MEDPGGADIPVVLLRGGRDFSRRLRLRDPAAQPCSKCCGASAGNAESTVAPRWPWIRIAYRTDAGPMKLWSSAGRWTFITRIRW